jgi:hypothetical protein
MQRSYFGPNIPDMGKCVLLAQLFYSVQDAQAPLPRLFLIIETYLTASIFPVCWQKNWAIFGLL